MFMPPIAQSVAAAAEELNELKRLKGLNEEPDICERTRSLRTVRNPWWILAG